MFDTITDTYKCRLRLSSHDLRRVCTRVHFYPSYEQTEPTQLDINELNRIVGTSGAWTADRRARQAEWIRRWQPWRRSTGPRTTAGKERSCRNAEKFGRNPEWRRAYLLIEQAFRDGKVTTELGEIFLNDELSGAPVDTILDQGVWTPD